MCKYNEKYRSAYIIKTNTSKFATMKNMGCIPSNTVHSSSKLEKQYGGSPEPFKMQGETIVQAYLRLDNDINEMEKESLGSQTASVLPLMQIIQEELMRQDDNPITLNTDLSESNEESLAQVIIDLQLRQNTQTVSEHEEFIATVNRHAIKKITKSILQKKFDELKEMKSKLDVNIEKLQLLYKEQDYLLERVLGAQYGSVEERSLEASLSKTRALRDTLAVGARAWRDAASAAIKANTSASSALLAWQLVSQTRDTVEQVRLAVEARNGFTAGIQEIRSAQNLLPAAQFPHCTARQIQALSLTVDYMFTDMYSDERYKHATRVFSGFLERTLSLAKWISEVSKTSLDKDLFDIEDEINRIMGELRAIRVNLIVDKGYEDVRYKRPEDLSKL